MVHEEGQRSWNCDFQAQVKALRDILESSGLFVANLPKVYRKKRHKNRQGKPSQSLEVLHLTEEDHKNLYIMQLQGHDGHVRHAVAMIDHMIFDSNIGHPLKFTKESLDWCCNCDNGFYKVYYALSWTLGPKAIAMGYS
jgi:hypothetical protein